MAAPNPAVRVLRTLPGVLHRAAYVGVDPDGHEVELWRIEPHEDELRSRLWRLWRADSPHLCRVHTVEAGGDAPHVVMARLGDPPEAGTFAPERIRDALLATTVALAEAHRLGVVHGALTRLDLGQSPDGLRVDMSGLRTAVPEEVPRAPELAAARVATSAADVWSLARVARELCAGPLDGATDELLSRMSASDPEARPSARQVQLELELGDDETAEDVTLLPTGVPQRLGPYRLVDSIGAGGMGSVYRAETETADGHVVEVAVKLLSDFLASDPLMVQRFQREARVLSQLDTPYIARFLNAAEDAGYHYLVMEFVRGRDVLSLLKDTGALGVPLALHVTTCVARALRDVHAHGLIHRDIKPSNIILVDAPDAEFPPVKLCDFGLARTVEQDDDAQLTALGATPGTPKFMAPEQIRGRELGPPVDVYALGATLFALVTGRPPYLGPQHAVLAAHVADPVPDARELVPDLDERLTAIIERAMAKDPAERFEHAGAMLDALEEVSHGPRVPAHALPQAPTSPGRKPLTYRFEWTLESDPAELWPHVSNTERLNRAIGLDDVAWEHENKSGMLQTHGSFRAAGMQLRWKENPFEWVAPRRLGVLREYESGPFETLRSVVELVPREGGGTELTHSIEVTPKNVLGRAAAAVEIGMRARSGLGEVYARIDAIVRAQEERPDEDPFEPAPRLRREQRRRIDEGIVRTVRAGGDPTIAQALGEYLRAASPQAIGRIRSKVWARARGFDPMKTLDTFLLATNEGVLTFLWDLLCPACRIPASIEESLRALQSHGSCEACDLDFELDLARSVELVFRSHAEVRPADLGVYCIGGPGHSPHVLAQVRLPAEGAVQLDLELGPGVYQVTGRRLRAKHRFQVIEGAQLTQWNLPLGLDTPSSVPRRFAAGEQHLVLTNHLGREVVARVEKVGEREDAVTAADAAGRPLFRQLFPGEVLSPNQLVSLSHITLLLVEVGGSGTGSDREQYSRLMELQQRVDRFAAPEGGSLVKLHGAGVLTTFTDRLAAIRAIGAVFRNGSDPIRAALHAGPAMVTTINGHLDYFGHAVHVASHLLQHGRPGELTVSEDVAATMDAADQLIGLGARSNGVFVSLDGTFAHRFAF